MAAVHYTVLSVILFIDGSLGYASCPGTAFLSDGYTYTLDPGTGEKVWSHCSFPNPLHDHAICGRPINAGNQYVCDPDFLIGSMITADNIDRRLLDVQTKTGTVCRNARGEDQSYIAALVVIDRIRIPDLRSTTLCVNECGELYPTMNRTAAPTGYPSQQEKEQILANFADGIRQLWQLGSCGNDVIVLYCREFHQVYISAGVHAARLLTESKLQHLRNTFMSYINEGSLEDGLVHVIDSLRVTLRSLTTAHVLLIINMLLLVAVAAWFFYYLAISETYMNVWGRDKPWLVLEGILQACSGIGLIKAVVLLMTMTSHKGKGLQYSLMVAVAVFVGFIALYFVSKEMLTIPAPEATV